jgi:hypothetical protein
LLFDLHRFALLFRLLCFICDVLCFALIRFALLSLTTTIMEGGELRGFSDAQSLNPKP